MTLHDRFRARAETQPDSVAIIDGDQTLTYRALAERADALTRQLADARIPPGTLIGLSMPHSAETIVAALAILNHHCAYIPIDPAHPDRRRDHLLADAAVPALITCDPNSGAAHLVRRPTPPEPTTPPGTAYVLYTSDATGHPKGVLIGHRQVLALFDASTTPFTFGPDDVWTLTHPYSFDLSVWEMWGALLHGGTLVVVPPALANDPPAFAHLLTHEHVTVLNQVPTTFGHLVNHLERHPTPLPALRHVILGGEPVSLPVLHRWHTLALAPRARLTNMYGITETTAHVTHCPIDADTKATYPNTTPIGHPLPHAAVHVVDDHLRPVPDGVAGELLVTGDAVADGYLHRPDLTNERFVATDDGTAYRSGDWGIRAPDGSLHHGGRLDRQIKLEGHRVELGEIEHAARSHPAVADCAVTVDHTPGGQFTLTGHYVLHPGVMAEPADIARHLSSRLPRHLRPARWRRRDHLPVTTHGKVDHHQLRQHTPDAAVRTRSPG